MFPRKMSALLARYGFFYGGGGEGGRLDVKVLIQESLSGKWVHCIIVILL